MALCMTLFNYTIKVKWCWNKWKYEVQTAKVMVPAQMSVQDLQNLTSYTQKHCS